MMSELEANQLPLQTTDLPCYTTETLDLLKDCALKFHEASKISIQAAQSLIDFIGQGKTLEEYRKHNAFKTVLEQIKVHAVADYASKRRALMKAEKTIDADDHFPFEVIMGIESMKEFRTQYTDVDYPKARLFLLDHERKVGKEKVYHVMR